MSAVPLRAHASKRDDPDTEQHYRWDPDRGEAHRPFRLWDATAKKNLRWRNYADPKRAHMGALIECRWSGIGQSIEVYDVRTGRLLGQYTRRVNKIQFTGE